MRGINFFRILVLAVFFVLPVSSAFAAEWGSAKKYVSKFYSWYLKKSLVDDDDGPAWAAVVRKKPQVLSSRLRRYLSRDLKKKERSTGMIEGIDFDPFTGSQDQCEKFSITNIEFRKMKYAVSVKLKCGDSVDSPNLKLILTRTNNNLSIDEIYYNKSLALTKIISMK